MLLPRLAARTLAAGFFLFSVVLTASAAGSPEASPKVKRFGSKTKTRLAPRRPAAGGGYLKIGDGVAPQVQSPKNDSTKSAEEPASGLSQATKNTSAASVGQTATSVSGTSTLGGGGVSGGGKSAGAAAAAAQASGPGEGISCADSYPPLTGGVIYEELPDLVKNTNKVVQFAYGPNQAISYKFTATAGGFGTNEGTAARRTSTLITVSEIPCDFDIEKALAGIDRGPSVKRGAWDACRIYNVGPGGVINLLLEGEKLPPGYSPIPFCWLKPGKTYYFNIRSFQADNVSDPNHRLQKSDLKDSCAEDAKNFGFGPSLKCGGIWQFIYAKGTVKE